jgi:hypothetical protein
LCDQGLYFPEPIADLCSCIYRNLTDGICTQTYSDGYCSAKFVGCVYCTDQECLACSSEFRLESQNCICIVGSEANETCTSIAGCTWTLNSPTNPQRCLACNSSTFWVLPVSNVCECLAGTLLSGVCNTIVGCQVPQIGVDGEVVCVFCNSSAGFLRQPFSVIACSCKPHY